MAELKTKKTQVSVKDFLNALKDEQKREDSFTLLAMMEKLTKEKPRMWGTGMVGFGDYHYKYASGHEGDTFIIGFAPRKEAFSLYLCGVVQHHIDLVKQLGKYKNSAGCIYVKKLEDIDLKVLKELCKKVTQYVKSVRTQ